MIIVITTIMIIVIKPERQHVCVRACVCVCVCVCLCVCTSWVLFYMFIAFLSFFLWGSKSDLIITLSPRHSLVSVNINCANFSN